MNQDDIDNLRKAMGTLPSQFPKKSYDVVRGVTKMDVEMYDFPRNPYKTICESVVSTWGDDKYEAVWPKLSPQNRFKVVLATLQGLTLPTALETINFSFIVRNLPRHCFDQHARARIGCTFFSIGTRDNCKLDSSLILYTKLYDKLWDKNGDATEFGEKFLKHMEEMKDIYEEIIQNKGSWQIARALLPMSFHHSYKFSCNFLALQGQCARRMCFAEEEFIVALHWKLRELVGTKFPLMSNYLRPACDKAKKCLYSKSYELSNSFGCLFAGCGRWPSGTEYATFNESCSDKKEIEKQTGMKIPNCGEWINYTEDDYDKLDERDKKLFEEN
jgi:thymidylate synthase ThyX